MPVIPLYQDGQTRVARRPSQGITGNPAAGVRVSIASIAGDLQAPLMSTAGVEAQGRAGAALGSAIADVGGIAGKVAMERFDAQNKIDVAGAEAKMDAKAAEFEQWKMKPENQDPRGWRDGWTKHMEGFNPIDDKMSPNAAESVTARYKLFQGQSAINIQNDVNKQTFANARSLDISRIRIAADQGDVEKVKEIAKGTKLLHPGEEESFVYSAGEKRKDLDKQAAADKEKASLTDVQTVAGDNIEEAEKMAQSLPPHLKPRALDIIRGQKRDQFIDAQSAVLDGLALAATDPQNPKAIITETDVDRVAPKGLSPGERAHLKEIVGKDHSDAARAEAGKPEVIRERFGRLLDLAAKFDPAKTGGTESQETRDQFQYIMMESALLPEKLRGEVTQPVSERWRTGAPTIDTTIKGYISESLQDIYDNGGFGKTFDMVDDPVTFARVKQVDEEGQKKARAQFADAKIALNEWMKENPKATREEATAAIYRKSGQSMRPEEAARILKQANTDTTAPAGNFDWEGKALRMGAPPGAEGETGPAGPTGTLDESMVNDIKDMETFIPAAYGDYKQTSVGYGTRAKSSGEVLTKAEADTRLREELSMHAGRIDSAAKKAGITLTTGQRNALISFDFNTGSGAHLLETSGGDMQEVKRRLQLYTKAGGEELKGLQIRRKREAAMFDNP